MTTRRVTSTFSMFGTQKVPQSKIDHDVAMVRRAIKAPLVRERLALAEMFGYYEQRPLTDDPQNPPAFRTVKISVSDDGVVTHTEEMFNTFTGDAVDAMEHSGVGGWSWAYVDGSGKPDWRRFTGFDYKRRPNISASFGRVVPIFESAPEESHQMDDDFVVTGRGDRVAVRWTIRDVADLVVSNLQDGTINPAFPQELQPRDRTTLKSKLQVANIAKGLNFADLSDSEFSGAGAPIIGPDNVVESGNGRVMGIARAYVSNSADGYLSALRDNIESYGLTRKDVDQFTAPILVRERTQDVDRIKFAEDSNVKPEKTTNDEGSAMLEAAKPKKGTLPQPSPINAPDSVMELIQMIKGGLGKIDDEAVLGRFIGLQLRALWRGKITREQYISLVSPLIGKKPGEMPYSSRFDLGSYISMKSELPFFADDTVFKLVVWEGRGFEIKEAAARWQKAKNTDERREAARDMFDVVEPFLKSVKQKGKISYGWRAGADRMIEAMADGQMPSGWGWWSDRWSFDPTPPMSVDEQHSLAIRLISKGKDVANGIDADRKAVQSQLDTIVERNQSEFDLWNDNPVLRGDEVQKLVRMLKTARYNSTGPDTEFGSQLHQFQWAKRFHESNQDMKGLLRNEFKRVITRIDSQRIALVDNSPVTEDEAASYANGMKIDPKLERDHAKEWGNGVLRQWIAECYRAGGGKFISLREFQLDTSKEKRAFANKAGWIKMYGGTQKKTLWHEMGHHWEYSNPMALNAARGYVMERQRLSNDDGLTRLSNVVHDGYGANEYCIKDQLSSAYIGKVYAGKVGDSISTEVFSSAFEFLANSTDLCAPVSVLNGDGLLEFAIAAIMEVHASGGISR